MAGEAYTGRIIIMNKQKCWVWFKSGITEPGHWHGGFVASSSEQGGLLIERSDYVTCRVPEWRVCTTEPEDPEVGPKIPEDAAWKLH